MGSSIESFHGSEPRQAEMLLLVPTWAMSKIPAALNALARSIPRIDVHHHYFPSDLKKEQSNVDVGWKTPPENLPWSPQISLQAMDAMKVDFAILSFPAISSGCISEESRATARRRNELAAGFCRDHPDRFSFFATLPFLEDIEGQKLSFDWSIYFWYNRHSGCLQEIKYSLDILDASGVSLSSSYGEGSTASTNVQLPSRFSSHKLAIQLI